MVRNPGSGKAPHNGPATGKGWGGPAKGAGNGNPRNTFAGKAPAGPDYERRKVAQAEQAEVMKDLYWAIATSAEEPTANRLTAADKLLDRIEGRAVQRVVTPDDGAQWFISGVPEAESMESWTADAKLASAKPAGNAD